MLLKRKTISGRWLFQVAKRLYFSSFPRNKALHDWTMRCFEKAANRGYGPACELYGHILIHKGVGAEAKIAGVRYLEAIPIDQLSMQASYQLYQVFNEGSFAVARDPVKAERYRQRAKALEHPLLG